MRKNKQKILSILLIVTSIISIEINAYAHSGRTDSSGGHKDNKNKSGLGSYHYHCGGNPAHLHTNGVCPYSSSNKSSTSSSSTTTKSSNKSSSSNVSSSSSTKSNNTKSNTSTESSNVKTTSTEATTVVTTVLATAIQINENIESIEVGKSEKLTATITPNNVTDKNITWKSSDDSIATIDSTGEVVAKKEGTVNITATTSNGKTNAIKINIKEEKVENEEKIENNTTIKTSTISATSNNNTTKNMTANNTITNNEEDSNIVAGILTLGLLGGGCYWGYKKLKKSNEL